MEIQSMLRDVVRNELREAVSTMLVEVVKTELSGLFQAAKAAPRTTATNGSDPKSKGRRKPAPITADPSAHQRRKANRVMFSFTAAQCKALRSGVKFAKAVKATIFNGCMIPEIGIAHPYLAPSLKKLHRRCELTGYAAINTERSANKIFRQIDDHHFEVWVWGGKQPPQHYILFI